MNKMLYFSFVEIEIDVPFRHIVNMKYSEKEYIIIMKKKKHRKSV